MIRSTHKTNQLYLICRIMLMIMRMFAICPERNLLVSAYIQRQSTLSRKSIYTQLPINIDNFSNLKLFSLHLIKTCEYPIKLIFNLIISIAILFLAQLVIFCYLRPFMHLYNYEL